MIYTKVGVDFAGFNLYDVVFLRVIWNLEWVNTFLYTQCSCKVVLLLLNAHMRSLYGCYEE